MTYVYRCPSCERRREVNHGMAEEPFVLCDNRPESIGKVCGTQMRRVPQIAYFTAVPFHLSEGNRFHGDKMDRKEYDNKYNQDAREKRKEQDLKASIEEGQREGKDIVTPKTISAGPSLMDVVRQARVNISG